jgi:hypothetical protein
MQNPVMAIFFCRRVILCSLRLRPTDMRRSAALISRFNSLGPAGGGGGAFFLLKMDIIIVFQA